MDPNLKNNEDLVALEKASSVISNIEKSRNCRLVTLIDFNFGLMGRIAYILNKMLRGCNNLKKLDLFIESGGGDINAAAKIANICTSNCGEFSVIVPFYAKSAASLIALMAKELVMTSSAELGPIDPQIRHPVHTGYWIPAHSIEDGLRFVEETKDHLVKLTMADKFDPLLIGAFQDARNGAKQYVEEALGKLPRNKFKEAVATFIEKYKSHGYPIRRDQCRKIGLKVIEPDTNFENLIFQLHEIYLDFLLEKCDKGLIIQTSENAEICLNEKIFQLRIKKESKEKSIKASKVKAVKKYKSKKKK